MNRDLNFFDLSGFGNCEDCGRPIRKLPHVCQVRPPDVLPSDPRWLARLPLAPGFETATEEAQRKLDHLLSLANEIAELRCVLADALGIIGALAPYHARQPKIRHKGHELDLDRARELCTRGGLIVGGQEDGK